MATPEEPHRYQLFDQPIEHLARDNEHHNEMPPRSYIDDVDTRRKELCEDKRSLKRTSTVRTRISTNAAIYPRSDPVLTLSSSRSPSTSQDTSTDSMSSTSSDESYPKVALHTGVRIDTSVATQDSTHDSCYSLKPRERGAVYHEHVSRLYGMSPNTVLPDIVVLKNIPGYDGPGMGIATDKAIESGTRIMSESAVYSYFEPLTQYRGLDLEWWIKTFEKDIGKRWELISHLYNNFPEKGKKYGTVYTNSVPLGYKESDLWAVFPAIARLNHSCQPNAFHYWDAGRQVYTLYAARDIEAGEEITISYDQCLNTRSERQRIIKAKGHFTCRCRKCRTSDDAFSYSDERIVAIKTIFKTVTKHLAGQPCGGPYSKHYTAAECLSLLRIATESLEAEGLYCLPCVKAAELAMLVASRNKDPARTKEFARRLADIWLKLAGPNSSDYELCKSMAYDPKKHYKFGIRGFFRGSYVPSHMSDRQFERWLWRKKGKSEWISGHLAVLRSLSVRRYTRTLD